MPAAPARVRKQIISGQESLNIFIRFTQNLLSAHDPGSLVLALEIAKTLLRLPQQPNETQVSF